MTATVERGTTGIEIRRAERLKEKPDEGRLGFGTLFTDHMLVQEYAAGAEGTEEKGWQRARIGPYGPIALDPAAAVLHYGQGVFDGLKAFRGVDGRVRLFRPRAHLERLARSAERLCIPAPDVEEALEGVRALVALEHDWVPRAPGTALYVRPTIVATEPFLGVRPSRRFLFFVILSPVGAYYPEGLAPVKILVEAEQVRAVEGGLGGAKTGANYAASLYAGERARREGYSQVLWLDGRERRYLEEVGAMNLMLLLSDGQGGQELVTPPLSGSILPGVTRDSALTLLRDWGVSVSERKVSIDEVLEASRDGRLMEVWGTGTAAVVSPVGELGYRGERILVNGGRIGELTQRLYDALTAIQYGRAEDTRGWMEEV